MKKISENRGISYCGLNCEACPLYSRTISKAAENLGQLTTMVGFDQMAEFLPEMAWFKDFKGYLKWLKENAVCDGCRHKGKQFHKSCELRNCCTERETEFCHECGQFPCTVVDAFDNQAPYFLENLKKIMDLGLEEYRKIKQEERPQETGDM